jgi:hypothetical protein
MLLGIPTHIVKQVEYLVFLILIIVRIISEFALDLELLAKKHRILSVRE